VTISAAGSAGSGLAGAPLEVRADSAAGARDLIVVANRLPIESHQDDDGATTWERSPGGLVSALEPVLTSRPSTWVGWSGRCSDEDDYVEVPEHLASLGECELHEISLTRSEVRSYYDGFSNAALWPLYHDAIVSPVYHRTEFDAYRTVNRRFAQAVAELAAPGATVWVHDYQLQLVPGMLRELRPDLVIGFFLHIPFPPIELYLQMPWRAVVLHGLLGADVVGFQSAGGAGNFRQLAERLLSLQVDGDDVLVEGAHGPRRVRVADFPISIDSHAIDALARDPRIRKRAADTRRALGNPEVLLLGVDRLDYTKGIDIRIQAYEELLEEGAFDAEKTVLVQVATPSRENVEEYQRIRDEVALIVGRALGAHGKMGTAPIHYLHHPVPREDLVALYVAADIMLVTPLRDGMNLVCKEYVASRINDDGALVLSEFTGAAAELPDAWLVNPYDADGMKDSIVAAATASPESRARRMRALRAQVFEHDVERWARSFLDALEEVTAGRPG
jgi:trehalose 6-phosphate synthase